MLLRELTQKARAGIDLSAEETASAIDAMIHRTTDQTSQADFLIALADKGESYSELAGAAKALRAQMQRIYTTREVVLDTCGTGGDHSGTFNISTAAAIVASAAGVPVAKHGNRSITSKSGSADVLRRLGVNIDAPLAVVQRCLDEIGICFCFAPQLHPAVGNVAAVRKRLGRPTIFNWIGPLCNPADTPFQLLGVGKKALRPLMAAALRELGTQHGVVVCGADGLDEVTLATETLVSRATPAGVEELSWRPEDFGIDTAPLDRLKVESSAESADVIRKVLAGHPGSARDIVALNAAAALWVANFDSDKHACLHRVTDAMDGGAAARQLDELSRLSHESA
jgi:anthranilate phosphoribosyltransferase